MSAWFELIEAMGAFWPDARAQQIILEQLDTWHDNRFDGSQQRFAIRALAQRDSAFLLRKSIDLYDAGRLQHSAREELVSSISFLAEDRAVSGELLLGIIKRLACDRDLSIREQLGQRLGLLDPVLCRQVYEDLSQDSDEWSSACAVATLGFWDSDEQVISTACYAEELLVRYAAQTAWKMRQQRPALRQLVEQYRDRDSVARLAAFLCIKEYGDEQIIWKLRESIGKQDPAYLFLIGLTRWERHRSAPY